MAPSPLGTELAQATTNHPDRKTREARREIPGQQEPFLHDEEGRQTKDQKATHYASRCALVVH
jgi:hypothetical protein